MHEEWEIKIIPDARKMILRLKNSWEGSLKWEREVSGGEESARVKRDWEKWKIIHVDPIYRLS